MTTTPRWRPAACPNCGEKSTVKEIVRGMPTSDVFDDPHYAIYGCVITSGESPEWVCTTCDHEWTPDLRLSLGEAFATTGRDVHVSENDLIWLPRIRQRLIAVAQDAETITYRDLKSDVGFPHAPSAVGRLMDLISADCGRRDEPSLAAIAVNSVTGEVGDDFDGDPAAERANVFEMWSDAGYVAGAGR